MQETPMKKSSLIQAKILTYSGTLPLVASALSSYFPVPGFQPVLIATSYGAIILSFLGGIHWATYLFFAEKCPRNLLLTSNIVALFAWASLLVKDQPLAITVQALCFVYLLTLDVKLRDAGIVAPWFYALRRNATIIVVLCLAFVARQA
jgi:hypothetical protein